ncbi:ubiquinone biosynthesis protein COQ9 [Azospirillaceae bacterium]
MDMAAIKDNILLAALPNVVFDGWSHQTMRDATLTANYDPSMELRAFPKGPADLVEHFSVWADDAMRRAMADRDLAAMRLPERVAAALRARFESLAPHREAVRRSIAFLALPANVAMTARLLYRTVDEVWYIAGDVSTDFSFYTKRAMLATVISAATLYWLEDKSDDSEATWAFINRRIAEIAVVGKSIAQLNKFSSSSAGEATSGTDSMSALSKISWCVPSPFRFARYLRRRANMA